MLRLLRPLALPLLLATAPLPTWAEPVLEDYSGMTRLDPARLLLVSDLKTGRPGPRAAALTLGPRGTIVTALELDWGEEPLPNDLEACAALPGREGEALLAESGRWRGRFGRIFRVRVERDRLVRLAQTDAWADPQLAHTPSHEQIEGVAALVTPAGATWLVLGERGDPDRPGRLRWGRLDEDRYQDEGSHDLDLRPWLPGARSCTELLLLPHPEGGWRLLSVAATDPGDLGPFSSTVFEVGRFEAPQTRPIQFIPCPPQALHRLEGLKVEALSLSPEPAGGSTLCVGTDDERLGPVWRPLPLRPPAPSPPAAREALTPKP